MATSASESVRSARPSCLGRVRQRVRLSRVRVRVYSHSRCDHEPDGRLETSIMKANSRWVTYRKGERAKGDRWNGESRPADKSRFGPPAPCVCCGVKGPITARGLRQVCYDRYRRQGVSSLERWPKVGRRATYSLEFKSAKARAEQYRDMTTGPGAISRKRACMILGISERTAYRYEAWFRVQTDQGINDG